MLCTHAHARLCEIPLRLIYMYIYIFVVESWCLSAYGRSVGRRCGIACRVLLGRMETSTWPSTPPRDSISIPSRFHARDIIRNPHRARASSAWKNKANIRFRYTCARAISALCKNPMERAVVVFSILIRLGLFSAARILFLSLFFSVWITLIFRREILKAIPSLICVPFVDKFVISSRGKWFLLFLSNNRNNFIYPPRVRLEKGYAKEEKFVDGSIKK